MKHLLFISLMLVSSIVRAETSDSAKRLLIDELLVQTGQSAKDTGKLFSNVFIEQMTTALKQAKPNIDPKAFDVIEQEVKLIIDEALLNDNIMADILYPIYSSRFSEEELKELIAFYKTPLGKQLLQNMPAITQEAMQAGQKFGQSLGPKIQERILARFKSEGIEL